VFKRFLDMRSTYLYPDPQKNLHRLRKATVEMFDNVLFDNSKMIMFDWQKVSKLFFGDRKTEEVECFHIVNINI